MTQIVLSSASRYTNNLGNHMMRSHKPLMAYVLWSNVLYTGGVNNICRQILRLFSYMVHLRYPEDHIRIMTVSNLICLNNIKEPQWYNIPVTICIANGTIMYSYIVYKSEFSFVYTNENSANHFYVSNKSVPICYWNLKENYY